MRMRVLAPMHGLKRLASNNVQHSVVVFSGIKKIKRSYYTQSNVKQEKQNKAYCNYD